MRTHETAGLGLFMLVQALRSFGAQLEVLTNWLWKYDFWFLCSTMAL